MATLISHLWLVPTAFAVGAWQGTALRFSRRQHTATPIKDGRVVLIGGNPCDDVDSRKGSNTGEVFDPRSMSSEPLPEMKVPRQEHSASLLKDGRIVIAGGAVSQGARLHATAAVEILKVRGPEWRWDSGPRLLHARRAHTTVVIGDGRMLVIGGFDEDGKALASTEIWDGRSPGWTEGPALESAKGRLQAHLLDDGQVLVIGALQVPEVWNPKTRRWHKSSPGGFFNFASPVTPEALNSIKLLDGSIAAAHRKDFPGAAAQYLIEVWTPRTQTWKVVASGKDSIAVKGSAVLLGGEILFMEGKRFVGLSTSTWSWRSLEPPLFEHLGQVATRLSDGRVLVTGGQLGRCDWAEVWNPKGAPPGQWSTGVPSANVMAVLSDGRVLMGTESGTSLWDPATGDLGRPTKMNVRRERHFTVALADGRLLVAGGVDPSKAIGEVVSQKRRPDILSPDTLSSAEIYSPSTNRWTLTKPLAEPQNGEGGVLLGNGDAFVFGGSAEMYGPQPDQFGYLYTFTTIARRPEVWSASTQSWRVLDAVPALSKADWTDHLRLDDGRIMVSTSTKGDVQIYDPVRHESAKTGSMLEKRSGAGMIQLRDGRVLVAGGTPPGGHLGLASAEIWTPATGAWSSIAPLNAPMLDARAVTLSDGRALVAGYTSTRTRARPEIWDPTRNQWTPTVAAPHEDVRGLPVLLRDGRVLMQPDILTPGPALTSRM